MALQGARVGLSLGGSILPDSAPSWILSQAENLASLSLQDGFTEGRYSLAWTTHPLTTKIFFLKCCAVSPPQQNMCSVPLPSICFFSMLCGVPTKFVLLIKKVCGCPPLPVQIFLWLCHTWLCLVVENLSSYSLQDEATDCFFLVCYLALV